MGVRKRSSAVLFVLLLVVAGCSNAGDRLRDTVFRVRRRPQPWRCGRGGRTDDRPAAAGKTLDALFASLGKDVHVGVTSTAEDNGAGTFGLDTTWKFGPQKQIEWTTALTAGP